ncbi:MAG TPA: hypothetical protein VMU19_02770 [Bryobacteraceae bacterium]|nr:hypothetical protein [Bryobacteraceae bacterium]
MKKLQVALLVGVGAIGGILLSMLISRPRAAPPVTVASAPAAVPSAPAMASAPAAPPEPLPVAAPEKPSPVPVRPVRKERETKNRTPVAPVSAASAMAGPNGADSAVQSPPTPAALPDASIPAAAPVSAPPVAVVPARPAAESAPPPAPSAPPQVTLNAGTTVPVRLVDGLSTERNHPGDSFNATLDQELVAGGFVIAEKGARAEGRVTAVDRGAKLSGNAILTVELTRIHLSDGQTLNLTTDSYVRHGPEVKSKTVTKIGAGAIIGAVIGGIAGGGKGAAIGAGAGGGAGAGAVALGADTPATLPSETRIDFRINRPVTVTERAP